MQLPERANRVLIVGGGGREHALAWKIAMSSRVDRVFVAPGNAGTALDPAMTNVDIADTDANALRDFAASEQVTLTVVGPEAPLAGGIVDVFEAAGLKCFGPTADAARLEASKAFSKDFLARHAIPTADYAVFTDADAAIAHIDGLTPPIVVKADGLASGKGVDIAPDRDSARDSARRMLDSPMNAGTGAPRIVVEQFLTGEEASFIALVDGETVLPLASSQDHKAAFDGDTGPNTGGMGAYSPAPVMTPAVLERAMTHIIRPTVAGMAADGYPFRGFLYAGLMIDDTGAPRVLEFNVRLGDPETQPILLRLDSDLVDLIDAALAGQLDSADAAWRPETALGVVMASAGYPGDYDKGHRITGLEAAAAERVKVFHAGTTHADDDVRTSGGRVLCVTALGADVRDARQRAYRGVECIDWPGAWYRTDIGHRAIKRESQTRE